MPTVLSPNTKMTETKVAAGEQALDGANPTVIATGLRRIDAVHVGLRGTGAPGLTTGTLTYDTSGGTLSVYAWKPTSATNPTLIASTGTETFSWIAVGV